MRKRRRRTRQSTPARMSEQAPEADPLQDRLRDRLDAAERRLRERDRLVEEQARRLQAVTGELQQRISDAERARAASDRYASRMRFLAEAGQTLAGSLDYETTLRNVADLAVPAIADWCIIDLVGEDGELRQLAIAHADPDRVALVEELRSRYPQNPASPYGVHEVIRTGQPQLVADIAPDLIAAVAQDDEHRRILESLDLGSYLVVPLSVRGSIIGALTLVCSGGGRCYEGDDLEMAQELAARAATAIENARLVGELEQTQQHLEHSASELETQAEELHAAVEALESTTQHLLQSNEQLTAARDAAEDARRTAEDANAAKAQFLATMSHELRTPLNAIDGYAELLEMGIHGPVTAPQREALRRLRRAQKRLLSLVNDVLNFAKLEAGQIVFHYERVNLADLIADLEAVVTPRVAEKNQTLVIDSPTGDLEVFADAHKIEQILLQLLANAIKFTGNGGQIRISTGSEGSMAQIHVTDTGSGIPADRLNLIFEPFMQVQTGMIRDHGGVGLGLAISRDLAQRMNGDLRADSRVGAGSTFTLLLPLADEGTESHPGGDGDPGAERRGRDTGSAFDGS